MSYKRKLRRYDNGGFTPLTSQQQAYLNDGDQADNLAVGALDTLKKPNSANVGLSTATGALSGAKEGAAIGTIFGPEGTLIGAGAGALIGGVSSLFGAEGKQRQLNAQRQAYQQQQVQQNITRSDSVLAAYPTTGVNNAQYYKYGGMISKYYKKLAIGGGIGGDTTQVNRAQMLAANPNLPLSPTNPLMVEKRDGSIGQWGNPLTPDSPNPYIPIPNMQLSDKARGFSNTYYPAGNRTTPTPNTIHRSYAKGGQIRKMPQYTIQDPDMLNPDSDYSQLQYAKGGSIHINPANKGKFNATKAATGKTTEELTHSSNPTTRKRAQFALNASHWNKKAEGGTLAGTPAEYEAESGETIQGNPQLEAGTQLASDMYQVNGDTHENGGTMGAGGERVFSDRLKISPQLAEILKEAKIGVSPNATYAEATNKIGKIKGKMEDKLDSNFTPSVNTAKKMIDRLDQASDLLFQDQEMQKQASQAPTYAKGGRIPKYDGGGTPPYTDATPYNPNAGLNTYMNINTWNPNQPWANEPTLSATRPDTFESPDTFAQNTLEKEFSPVTPDVHPSFGSKFLEGVSDFADQNKGQITNFATYLANKGSINQLDTSVKRNYLSAPVYSYVNRSGQAISQNQQMLRSSLRALSGTSQGVNASNAGALYASTLNNNSKINNDENLRQDAYNENYNNRADRVNEFNTVTQNQANDSQRDLNNNKNVVLPLQARNAWLAGVMGNDKVKADSSTAKAKMMTTLLANDTNGVMTRWLKGYSGNKKASMLDALDAYLNN